MKKLILFLFLFKLILAYGQCPSNVILVTGNLTAPLTQSSTWIKTSISGLTTSDIASIIKLDADPTNGYVEINPGFTAFPTTGAFIAQALDGCGSLSPARLINNEISTNSEDIKVYPNPSKNIFNFNISGTDNGIIEVYNILGVKISENKFTTNSTFQLNLESHPTGVFTAKIISKDKVVSKVIIKD